MNRITFVFAILMTLSLTIVAVSSTEIQQTLIDENHRTLVMTYLISLHEDPMGIAAASFDDTEWAYVQTEIGVTDIVNIYTQEISHQETQSAENKFGPQAFAGEIEYDCDGFFGTLIRDDCSFKIFGTGHETINRTVSQTKKYNGLPQNDMAQIAKQYNGLNLSHVEWFDQNTGQLVQRYTQDSPGPYSCIAYYKGIKSSVVPTGYTANITYSGTVAKEVVEGRKVTITYVGTPLVTEKPPATIPLFPIIASSVCLLAGGMSWIIYLFRKKRAYTK